MSQGTAILEGGDRQGLVWMIGLAAGFSSAFLGIGGGLVLVPALILLLRCPIKRAIGTSLVAVLFISFAGVMADWEISGIRINWSWALALSLGSLLGSAVGARLIACVADKPLRLALAGVLIAASIRTSTGWLGPTGALAALTARPAVPEPLLIFMVGVGAGVTSVLIGVGGGIVSVPALALVYSDLPVGAIRGTSLAAIVVAAAVGIREYAALGHVDQRLTRALVPTGLAGAVTGVVASTYFPTRPWKLGLAVLLAVVAARLLADTFHPSGMGGLPSHLGRRSRQAGADAR